MDHQDTKRLLWLLEKIREELGKPHHCQHGKVEIMAQITVDININVSPAQQPFAVDASGVPKTAQVGVPYVGKLVASGGQAPYSFTLTQGAFPDGVSLDPNTGDITGTPTTAADFDATVIASDSLGAQAAARVGNA